MTEPDGYTETTEVETSVNEDGEVDAQTVTEHVELDQNERGEGE